MHGRLYTKARRLPLLLLVLSLVALTLMMFGNDAIRVRVTHVNNNTNLFLSDIGAELFNQILSLLLKRWHLIEDSSYHVSIGAVPTPTHSRGSHRYPASMLLPLFLAGLCHLQWVVVMVRLINIL